MVSQVSPSASSFAPTIPIVDMKLLEHPTTRTAFFHDLAKGLSVGFFGIVNPDIDLETICEGYAAFDTFFKSPLKEKMTMHDPKLNGQRGYIPGEIALGSKTSDKKEFVHVGRKGNLWPKHMDLEIPATRLFKALEKHANPILEGIATILHQSPTFFTDKTKNGESLMRALNYPPQPEGVITAEAHTDIDLLSLIPYASEDGLEVYLNDKWTPVVVPKKAFIFNVGDFLEVFSNGRCRSCIHRVVSKNPKVSRMSIPFFIHPTDDTLIKPLGLQIPRYPVGNRLEYLFLRLFCLGILAKENEGQVIHGEFIKRISAMVLNNTAADSVKNWHVGFRIALDERQKASVNSERNKAIGNLRARL